MKPKEFAEVVKTFSDLAVREWRQHDPMSDVDAEILALELFSLIVEKFRAEAAIRKLERMSNKKPHP